MMTHFQRLAFRGARVLAGGPALRWFHPTSAHGGARMFSLTVLAVVLAAAPRSVSGQASDDPADVWLICTRSAPLCGSPQEASAAFGYWRLGPDGQWQPADLETLAASDDPEVPTTIYIHGNLADRNGAIEQAWPVYQCLAQDPSHRRFRLIIWSWPADQVLRRKVRDLRLKASRSDIQSLYVAWYLDRMRPDVPVNLVGYSFGARVITGALHLLGGGQVAGYSLSERRAPRRTPVRAVLVAAAIGSDWLAAGHRHGQALGQVDRLLVTQNRCDPALKWYSALDRGCHETALGALGPTCLAGLGAEAAKIELAGVTCEVGRVHNWRVYLNAPELWARLPDYAFGGPAEAKSP